MAPSPPKVDYATGSIPVLGGGGGLQPGRQARPGGRELRFDSTVSVLLGNGDGTFAPKVDYATGSVPGQWRWGTSTWTASPTWRSRTTVDSSHGRSVLLGNGDGTFAAKVDYATGSHPDSVAVGDFNLDGKPDLAVANFTGKA